MKKITPPFKIHSSLESALAFLEKNFSERSGFSSFSTLYSDSSKKSASIFEYHTNFTNALILESLNTVARSRLSSELLKRVNALRSKLSLLLLSERSDNWSWSYWQKNHPEAKKFPIPDDLDDSSCAWSALYNFKPELFTGRVLAKITQLLIQLEENLGGPYKTWLIGPENSPDSSWLEIDLAVNANLAYFFSLQGIKLKGLKRFLETAIKEHYYNSDFYPQTAIIFYFLARAKNFLSIKTRQALIKDILEKNQSIKSPILYSTLKGTALFLLGKKDEEIHRPLQTKILHSQDKDGSWPEATYCYDPSLLGQKFTAQARSVTTAFVLEYLSFSLLNKREKRSKNHQNPTHQNPAWKQLIDRLRNLNLLQNQLYEPQLSENLKKLRVADQSHHISHWSSVFVKSLYPDLRQKISKAEFEKLGVANLWGWLAYTLYDDILDNDAPPKFVSLANIFQRELIKTFQKILPNSNQFWDIFYQTMLQIDQANWWESNLASGKINQLPDFHPLTKISHKSLGHALGPIGIIFLLKQKLPMHPMLKNHSSLIKNWIQFIKHYLTARQLHDDAHDWEEDLKKQHFTPVVSLLLKQAKVELKQLFPDSASQKKLYKIRKTYLHQTLPKTIKLIDQQQQLARKSLIQLEKISFFEDASFYHHLLNTIDQATKKAKVEQKNGVEFIENIKGK